jgi:hypothetical protein
MDPGMKEMIKFQMMSKLGSSQTGNSSDFKSMIIQFIMFIFMSLIDDITKSVTKLATDTKEYLSGYFNKKITETIVMKPTAL